MKRRIAIALSMALLALGLVIATSTSPAQALAGRPVLWPAYVHPAVDPGAWSTFCSQAPSGSTVIVNPASGPGTSVDPYYPPVIADCQSHNVRTVGYIDTNYGARTLAQLQADVATWYSLYPSIQGFFLDQVSTDPAQEQLLRDFFTQLKADHPDAYVVANPGTAADFSAWQMDDTPIADLLVPFEGTAADFLNWTAPSFVTSQLNKMAVLVHTTDKSQINRVLPKANAYAATFVTERPMPMPWDSVSTYWPCQLGTECQVWWKPTTSTPQPLHWVLDTGTNDPPIDVNNPCHVGERGLNCSGVLPAPKVLDIDGDVNTRTAATGDTAHVSRGVNEALHARGQKTICYMDAGVQEMNGQNTTFDREAPYRFPTDRHDKQSSWGGYWIDFTAQGTGTLQPDSRVLAVIEKRIDDWCTPGNDPNAWFDAIEFDEVDYWENSPTSPDVTYASQVTFNKALFALAHKYGLAAVHKGDLIQVQDLVNFADATLNEECARYRECLNPWNPNTGQNQVGLQAYEAQGKAVWVAEYTATPFDRLCNTYINPAGTANDHKWNGARYKLSLLSTDGRQPCAYSW